MIFPGGPFLDKKKYIGYLSLLHCKIEAALSAVNLLTPTVSDTCLGKYYEKQNPKLSNFAASI